uniref:Uncharacterized protein n=1 Tax=Lepeophtheirus salmonis TaxID=72036 RepID=A0A0K2VGK2_LEPSM
MWFYYGIYIYKGVLFFADELICLEYVQLHHLRPYPFPSDKIDLISRNVTSLSLELPSTLRNYSLHGSDIELF